jgi:hypothetical protein
MWMICHNGRAVKGDEAQQASVALHLYEASTESNNWFTVIRVE